MKTSGRPTESLALNMDRARRRAGSHGPRPVCVGPAGIVTKAT
jgi:hypothetical protein